MFSKKEKNSLLKPLGTYSVKHLSGLELPESSCNISVYKDYVSISTGAVEFELSIEKILSVSFEMNVDIERFQQSSKAKGIAGAVVFGVTGAVIGSAPTSKVKRNVTTCAIVSFVNSEENISYVVFEDIVPNSKQAAKFVDKIKPLIKTAPIKKKVNL